MGSVTAMASRGQLSVLLLVVIVGSTIEAAPRNASRPFVIEPRVNWNSNCRCGQKAINRIVGGATTAVNEWPWQVALTVNGQQFCGGSLINDRYVLTAAHCTAGLRPGEISIRLAEHRLSTTSETSLVTRGVSRIIDHANYEAGTELNDISLLKLSSPVEVSDTVLPVCMPPSIPKYANKNAWVTGWGTTSSGGSSSDTLVFKDGGGNYDLIGVVSWGVSCADSRYPGVYTRVNNYLNWIKQNTGDGVYCRGMKL